MKTVRWDLAGKCNLQCTHCIVGKTDLGRDLDLDDSKTLIDRFIQDGYKHVQLVIKEPFFHKDIDEIIRYIRLNGMSMSFVSNGTCLTDKIIEELYKASINYLAISLEGLTAHTNDGIRGDGSFKRALESITRIAERNKTERNFIPLILQICMTPQNVHEIQEQLINFMQEYKFVAVSLGNVHNAGNASDNTQILMTTSEYNRVVDSIIYNISQLDIIPSIIWKDMLPYDAVHYNLKHNTSIPVNLPFCTMFSGRFSVLPNGQLCRCSLLVGTSLLSDHLNQLEANYTTDLIISVDALDDEYCLKKEGFCLNCRFSTECKPCLFCGDDGHYIQKSIVNSCSDSCEKVSSIIADIVHNKAPFKIRSDTIIELSETGDAVIEHPGKSLHIKTDGEALFYQLKDLQESGKLISDCKPGIINYLQDLVFGDFVRIAN